MSKPRKYWLNDIFSFDNLQAINTNTTDLQKTNLYISKASNPTTTSLQFGKRQKLSTLARKWCGIITVYECQPLLYISKILKSSPSTCLALLQNKFSRRVDVVFIVLDTSEYITRSITINMSWCRRMWSLFSKAHMIAVTGVYYSVLGGAYCSLGKSNTKYAYKAGALAIEQIKLAQRLKDPVLECKCWLYFAEDLIQLGKFQTAQKIITLQTKFVNSLQEDTLMSMLNAVVGKMNTATLPTYTNTN